MKTIKDIINFTETFAPVDNAMSFDNCGLLVGNKNTEINRVLVCLDITMDTAKEAVKKQAQLIISHHPVIFSPLKSLDSDSVPYFLAANGISALCLHTCLDLSTEFGVNTCLAKALKLKEIKYFMDKDKEICLAVGKTGKSFTEEKFAAFVKERLNCKGVRFTKIGNKISTVALCSGSGGNEVYLAAEKGADVLVTGEIRHHQILDGNAIGISVVEAGHFKTENVVVAPLAKKLSKEFPKIEFLVSETCDDFVNYL